MSEQSPNRTGRDEQRLAAKLRSLTPPPVPPTLERKLLEAIPAQHREGRHRTFTAPGWLKLTGGVAAAGLLAVAIWSLSTRNGRQRTIQPCALASTSVRFIVDMAMTQASEETNPCSILPPFPE